MKNVQIISMQIYENNSKKTISRTRHKTQNYLYFTKMKATEKKQLIAQLIEKYEQNGYPIKNFIGKPLSYFDEEKVKNLLQNKHFFKC